MYSITFMIASILKTPSLHAPMPVWVHTTLRLYYTTVVYYITLYYEYIILYNTRILYHTISFL